MLNAYFSFGGNEVGNSARAVTYAAAAECPPSWNLRDPECAGIADAEDHVDYTEPTDAPWYDPDDPDVTARFLGLYVVDIKGLEDSTRGARVTQKNSDGAKISGYRHASREVRVTAWLSAVGPDALAAGMTWLRNVLEPDACGVHGGACQTSDFGFFVKCPATRIEDEPEDEYQARIAVDRRFLHSVRCVSGPLTLRERESGPFNGRLVEFTFVAEVPFVYGAPKTIDIPATVPTVIQDVPYNLVPYPSAELAGDPVITQTNYATNPSLETDATGWSYVAGSPILAGNVAGGRVTGELAAVGVASYRSVFTAPGAGGPGYFGNETEIALPAVAGARFSINIWSAALVMAGSPTLGTLEVLALWRSSSGGTLLRTDTLGTIDVAGGALSVKSVLPPVGATHVTVRARLNVTAYASGNIIRLYSDALAVTVP